MPRKSSYMREEILKQALKYVRKNGYDSLSARELSKQMGCSTSPLFTVFGSFEAVKEEVIVEAFAIFNRYVADSLNYKPAFKEYGRRLVAFGKEEPNLFKVMLMRDHNEERYASEVEKVCLKAIMEDYDFTEEQALLLMDQLYTFGTGLATDAAFGRRVLSDEEINKRLGLAFMGTVMLLKQGMPAEVVNPTKRENDDERITLDLDFMKKY